MLYVHQRTGVFTLHFRHKTFLVDIHSPIVTHLSIHKAGTSDFSILNAVHKCCTVLGPLITITITFWSNFVFYHKLYHFTQPVHVRSPSDKQDQNEVSLCEKGHSSNILKLCTESVRSSEMWRGTTFVETCCVRLQGISRHRRISTRIQPRHHVPWVWYLDFRLAKEKLATSALPVQRRQAAGPSTKAVNFYQTARYHAPASSSLHHCAVTAPYLALRTHVCFFVFF